MDELKADNVLQERLKSLPNVEVFVCSQTTEVVGNGDKLTALRIKDRKTEEEVWWNLTECLYKSAFLPIVAHSAKWWKPIVRVKL